MGNKTVLFWPCFQEGRGSGDARLREQEPSLLCGAHVLTFLYPPRMSAPGAQRSVPVVFTPGTSVLGQGPAHSR